MKNIILVGFMGTGKTAVAKRISTQLNLRYISTDDLIEKKAGSSISDIFDSKGEGYFRKLERAVVEEVSAMQDTVIDTGGGVILNAKNVTDLKRNGIVICLWASAAMILKRTSKYKHRPLLNVNEPLKKIEELLDFRKPFYERADYHINTSEMSIEDVVGQVKEILKNARSYQ